MRFMCTPAFGRPQLNEGGHNLSPPSFSWGSRKWRFSTILNRFIPACAGNGLRRKSKPKANLEYWQNLYQQKLSKSVFRNSAL
jgi:hypothetical protein